MKYWIAIGLILATIVSGKAEDVDPEKHQPGMTYVPDIKMPNLHARKNQEKPKKHEQKKQDHQSNLQIRKHYPSPDVVLTTVFRLIRDVVFGY